MALDGHQGGGGGGVGGGGVGWGGGGGFWEACLLLGDGFRKARRDWTRGNWSEYESAQRRVSVLVLTRLEEMMAWQEGDRPRAV